MIGTGTVRSMAVTASEAEVASDTAEPAHAPDAPDATKLDPAAATDEPAAKRPWLLPVLAVAGMAAGALALASRDTSTTGHPDVATSGHGSVTPERPGSGVNAAGSAMTTGPAIGSDPNAVGSDPNAVGSDPNNAGADPNNAGPDPNNAGPDPNAAGSGASTVGPGSGANAGSASDANAGGHPHEGSGTGHALHPLRPKHGELHPAQGSAAAPVVLHKVLVNMRTGWAYFTVDADPRQFQTMANIKLPAGPHVIHFTQGKLQKDVAITVPDRDDLRVIADLAGG